MQRKSPYTILEEKSDGSLRQNTVGEEDQIWSLINPVRSAPISLSVEERLAYLGYRGANNDNMQSTWCPL